MRKQVKLRLEYLGQIPPSAIKDFDSVLGLPDTRSVYGFENYNTFINSLVQLVFQPIMNIKKAPTQATGREQGKRVGGRCGPLTETRSGKEMPHPHHVG